MKGIFILFSLLIVSCGGGKILETHSSPDGSYIIQVELDRSERDDEHLGLRLLNKDGAELDYIITYSGNHMKWAVTWYSDKEIILDSHDVGLFGWIN